MCGFVGVIGAENAVFEVHMGLMALQHRGQDSAGIGEFDQQFRLHKGLGMVPAAIPQEAVNRFQSSRAVIGHVRYPTQGRGIIEDAQPFLANPPGLLIAHNGNLTNTQELNEKLANRSVHVLSRCDAEPMGALLASFLLESRPNGHVQADLVAAVERCLDEVRGGFSVVCGLKLDGKATMVVFRDRYGLRPATIGRRNGSWAVASESVALDPLNYGERFSPEPGEVVLLREGEEARRIPLGVTQEAPCIFEKIYFARPDAQIDGSTVYDARMAFGRELAREFKDKGLDGDVVVPIPDTSRPAAQAFAEELGIPYREGFIKNRYSGRTFIMPDVATRVRALRLKLNPIAGVFKDKRVILFDDSVVRGATIQRISEMVRDLMPASLHLAIHSPPVSNPCFYGIDMSTPEELFATRYLNEGYGGADQLRQVEQQMGQDLGLDSITYLSVEGVDRAWGGPRCAACFDGIYPQPISTLDRSAMELDRRSAADRLSSNTAFKA